MSRRFRTHPAVVSSALALIALITACTERGAERPTTADSDLARDLALVQSSGTIQPIFRDTALTTAPAPRVATSTPPEAVVMRAPQPVRQRQVEGRPPQPREAAARPVPRRQTPRSSTRIAEAPAPQPEPRPAQPIEATERATGAAAAGRIGAGAVLTASSNGRICTRSNLPGDRITATVETPVRGTNGAEIPAGAKVVLEVTSIDAAEPPASGRVVFRVTSVAIGDESYPASGSATSTGPLEQVETARNASSDRKKVIGGAIAGAILGQMMGKDTRSTVIGAAAGAAAGTAAAKMGDKGESCLAAGAATRIVLDEALVLP